ncbi:MAG: formylglycine-generating enzyme family protein [Thermosynechococcaceae cyanobacterium]
MKPLLFTTLALALATSLTQCTASGKIAQTTPDCEDQPGFTLIEAGEFIAGSDRKERDYAYQISADSVTSAPSETELRQSRWFEGEPKREVRSQPTFCISRNLVTNADYQVFVKATGHPSPGISEADYQTQGFLVHPYGKVRPYLWRGNQYPTGTAKHPVVLISEADAQAFAQWKGQQDGVTYRLPTALEWEKAARGTKGQYFPWGNQWRQDATHWGGSGQDRTSEIGAYPLSRSVYGVEDMAGNVFEYTSTRTERRGQSATVMKGCGWDDLPGFCRAAYRHARPLGSRHILFGFRLVRV